MRSSCHIPVRHAVGMGTLTGPSDQTEPLYRWAAQPESARTHKLPEPHFHLGLESAAACTKNKKTLTGHRFGEQTHLWWWEMELQPHLDDAVHVRDEAVNANFQQHDQSSANVLPNFTVLVASQCKQTLQREKGKHKTVCKRSTGATRTQENEKLCRKGWTFCKCVNNLQCFDTFI